MAELTGVRCLKIKNTNVGYFSVNINNLVGGSFKAPLKWELTSCQWGSTAIGYAYGLCRYDMDSGGTTANVLGKSGFTGEPNASINAEGVFTLSFGMQWSSAELRVYY